MNQPDGPELHEGIRLQKVLAQAGVASRRAAEDLIFRRRVEVNGEVVTEQGRLSLIHISSRARPARARP